MKVLRRNRPTDFTCLCHGDEMRCKGAYFCLIYTCLDNKTRSNSLLFIRLQFSFAQTIIPLDDQGVSRKLVESNH